MWRDSAYLLDMLLAAHERFNHLVLSQKRVERQHLAGSWAVKMTAFPQDIERIHHLLGTWLGPSSMKTKYCSTPSCV